MKYIANPVEVDAFKIFGIDIKIGDPNIYLLLENGEKVIATPEMTSRYIPKLNDYWVIQSDGYVYLNPKDVFERKYRKAVAYLESYKN